MDREQYENGRFAPYLNGQGNDMSRFLATEEAGEESSIPFIAQAGIAVAGTLAAAALMHRTGVTRQATRLFDTQVKGAYQAAREVMQQEAPMSALTRNLPKTVRSFTERRSALVNERVEKMREFGRMEEYDMERYIRQREQLLNEQIPFHIQETMRYRDVFRDVKSQMPQRSEAFRSAMESGPAGFLRYNDGVQMSHHLRTNGIRDQEAIDNFIQIQERYRNKNYKADSQEANAWIESIQEKMRKFTAENMDTLTRKESSFKSTINGHRQATIEDVLAMNKAGTIKIDPQLAGHMEEIRSYNKKFGETVFDQNLYVRERNGNITDWTDYKTHDDIRRGVQEWAAKTLPGSLMHMRDGINMREAREVASFRMFGRDSVQPMLNAQMGRNVNERMHEEMIYVNGKFVKLFDENVVNDGADMTILNTQRDMFLTSAKFGTIGKVSRQVSGMMTDNEKQRNWFMGTFDLGNQDKDAALPQMMSRFTKFFNPDWERNTINKALGSGVDYDAAFNTRSYFEKYVPGLSPRSLNNMVDDMPSGLKSFIKNNDITFSTDDDYLKVFKHLGEGDGADSSGDAIKSLWKRYQRDPDGYLHSKRPISDASLIGEHTYIQTGLDRVKQTLNLEVFGQVSRNKQGNRSEAFDFRQYIDDMYDNKRITKQDWQDSQFAYSHYQYNEQFNGMYSNSPSAINALNDLLTGGQPEAKRFQDNLRSQLHRTNPIYEKFSGTQPINKINDEYIATNRAFESTAFSGRIMEFFTDFGDKAKQMGFRTGKRNMEDFTPLSVFGSNYPIYRLQDALGELGLGFSDESLSSPLKMMSSLMLKRFLPIVVGTQYAQYADWEVDQATGASVSDRFENHKARTKLLNAYNNDISGETEELKRARMLTPGIEHFGAMPSAYLPGVGDVGPGKLLAAALGFGGTPLTEKDAYSAEEYENYLERGVDEVRKSRWWLFGSKSAYRGDRITEFQPNSYRLAMSDAEDSNTNMTGQERYGETNILPTLRNPLGILAFATGVNDPYYWEKKHYYDRPYMITGSMFNSNTVGFGDIGNATIGQILKPNKRMHGEYWGDPVLVQDETESLGKRPDSPVMSRVSPAGRVQSVVYAGPTMYGANGAPAYIRTNEQDEQGRETGAFILQEAGAENAVYVPGHIAKDGISMDQLFNMAQTNDEAMVDTKPRAMFDQDYAYKDEIAELKLQNLKDPRSMDWRLQEAWENWSEPLGVYKWIIGDELAGYKPYEGQTVIEKSDAANNLSASFKSLNMGSFGGQLSEIGRRFIRGDSGQLDQYNPIRNTMPDWMPGSEYFINFQVGDPYTKVDHGEYRMPGETYERLNALHPDETGDYGAFDKFKILADVAPWSDEYRFWRDYLVATNKDAELRKQAAEIKRQVADRKQKYEFTPYRFEYAELETQSVTVKKFLDDYSFTTEEAGDQVFRLAGMSYRPRAEGVLQSYIGVGDKVTIGLDAEKDRQVSSDTYKTARVVVYDKMRNINKDILDRGLMKENTTDFSSPAVFARFSEKEIRKGARWERIAHYESPLNTKFLQVRTALEEYERDQVYGKDWATWENFMIDDYLVPGFQAIIRHDLDDSMFRGAVAGMLVGGMLNIFGAGKKGVLRSGIVGALGAGIGNLYRQHYEEETGRAWVPQRRLIENDINEYFDVLKYMKYRGLYEEARVQAEEAGYDIDAITNEVDLKRENNKAYQKQLQDEKQLLFLDQPDGWEERRSAINKELEGITLDWTESELPEEVLVALNYREQSEKTLYGADPYGDRMKLASAFPYKDKWFFDEFANAPERDRERILELVPENEGRIYKALWGLEEEKPPELEEIFAKYVLPDASWEGWRPDIDLNDIKVKAVDNAGLDLSDFNFWPDDLDAASYVPDVTPTGNNIYNGGPQFSGYQEMQQNIQAVLEGQGLRDVKVSVSPSDQQDTRIQFQYEQDRSKEIDGYLKENISEIV